MEHYYSMCEYLSSNIYSIIINFLSTAAGAFLGFIFALIIFWISESNKRKNERYAERLKAFNTLKRFSFLLKNVTKTCSNQSSLLASNSIELKEKPLGYNPLAIHATNDLERLIKSDSLDLYHAFLLYESSDQNKFNNYRIIFDKSDFLQKYYSDLFLRNEKHQTLLYSELCKVKDNLLDISVKISLIQNSIKLSKPNDYNDDEEYIFLERFKNTYIALRTVGFSDFEPYRTKLLIPFQTELLSNSKFQRIANEILLQIVDSTTRMEAIILNTNAHAADFGSVSNNPDVLTAIEYLSEIHDHIENINEPKKC